MQRAGTEDDAVQAYAKAWNRLKPDRFLELLAPDASYASQWVFEELQGVAAISDYLRRKMDAARASGAGDLSSRVQVKIGRTTRGTHGRPCALMTQGTAEVKAVVIFEVEDGRIQRFDMCVPAFYAPVHSRIYP